MNESRTYSGSSSQIGRRDLLMLMLGLDPTGEVAQGMGGITRLQKFLFILEQEEHIVPTGPGFEFKPYKAGPYSRMIYDDLELLENLGLIQFEPHGEASEEEVVGIADLTFDHLMGDDAHAFSSESEERAKTADTLEERRFTLTDQGRKKAKELLERPEYKPFCDGIRKVKSRFSNYSLQDLLYYVYTNYQSGGWTSESEIRDQVLSRGRHRQ